MLLKMVGGETFLKFGSWEEYFFREWGHWSVEYVFKVGIIGVGNMFLRLGSLEWGICS